MKNSSNNSMSASGAYRLAAGPLWPSPQLSSHPNAATPFPEKENTLHLGEGGRKWGGYGQGKDPVYKATLPRGRGGDCVEIQKE